MFTVASIVPKEAPASGFSSMETDKSDAVITVAIDSSTSKSEMVTVTFFETLPEVILTIAVRLCTVSKSKRAASAIATTPVEAFTVNAPSVL